MRPLRIKASAYPVSSSNIQGLQEMTDTEIEQYYSAILTKDFVVFCSPIFVLSILALLVVTFFRETPINFFC